MTKTMLGFAITTQGQVGLNNAGASKVSNAQRVLNSQISELSLGSGLLSLSFLVIVTQGTIIINTNNYAASTTILQHL